MREFWGVVTLLCIFIVVVTQLCAFARSHRTAHQKVFHLLYVNLKINFKKI